MSKKSKGQKAQPEKSYWQKYYAAHKDKYKEWGRLWREKQKLLKGQVVVTAQQEEPAPKTKCSKKKSKAPTC